MQLHFEDKSALDDTQAQFMLMSGNHGKPCPKELSERRAHQHV
jgi:hypothetical protein